MADVSLESLRQLLDGTLDPDGLLELQRHKDPARREKILQLEQERLAWNDRIVECLQEHLYVVETHEGYIVRGACGQDFGDYRQNWKLSALVYERNPEDGEVYVGPRAADPQWMVLREFYCPGCGEQLEVESGPIGYPFVFNFLPDIVDP